MPVTINAQATTGLLTTADGSGIVKLQSDGKTTNAIAWANFAGSTGTARTSYNFSSITRNSTGYYTVAFVGSAADANYIPTGTYTTQGANSPSILYAYINSYSSVTIIPPTTSSFVFACGNAGITTNIDPTYVMISIFGN
jgi:hypothetical protein